MADIRDDSKDSMNEWTASQDAINTGDGTDALRLFLTEFREWHFEHAPRRERCNHARVWVNCFKVTQWNARCRCYNGALAMKQWLIATDSILRDIELRDNETRGDAEKFIDRGEKAVHENFFALNGAFHIENFITTMEATVIHFQNLTKQCFSLDAFVPADVRDVINEVMAFSELTYADRETLYYDLTEIAGRIFDGQEIDWTPFEQSGAVCRALAIGLGDELNNVVEDINRMKEEQDARATNGNPDIIWTGGAAADYFDLIEDLVRTSDKDGDKKDRYQLEALSYFFHQFIQLTQDYTTAVSNNLHINQARILPSYTIAEYRRIPPKNVSIDEVPEESGGRKDCVICLESFLEARGSQYNPDLDIIKPSGVCTHVFCRECWHGYLNTEQVENYYTLCPFKQLLCSPPSYLNNGGNRQPHPLAHVSLDAIPEDVELEEESEDDMDSDFSDEMDEILSEDEMDETLSEDETDEALSEDEMDYDFEDHLDEAPAEVESDGYEGDDEKGLGARRNR